MIKKSITKCLSLTLALSLAACASNNPNSSITQKEEKILELDTIEENQNSEDKTVEKIQEDTSKKEIEAKDNLENVEDLKKNKQMNSFSMMYYMAITAEEILTSKENKVNLEEIYTSLLNDVNPEAIDEITQEHIKDLREIIYSYLNTETKRERLQFLYNQEKTSAIRNAIPNPLAILSVTNALDWRKLAISVAYTALDSYNNYKQANEQADLSFIMSGWELDDEEKATVMRNRDRAFDYMVDMVQEYKLDGLKTLNEKAIERFVEICNTENPSERIKLLRAEEFQYNLLGDYWLELANAYFENTKYQDCLDCVEEYNKLSTEIYRKDLKYLQILPKAIVAA